MWFSSFEVLTVKHHLLKTLLLVSSLTWVGTAIAQTDNRPTVRVAVQQVANSGTLTPLREQSNVGSRSFPMIYAGLIELDRQGDLSLKPGLATSWKRIDDFTVELKLRKGVKFHNGDEMTADDVAFTFGPEYMFGSTNPWSWAKLLQPLPPRPIKRLLRQSNCLQPRCHPKCLQSPGACGLLWRRSR